jgi:hypothetical protein
MHDLTIAAATAACRVKASIHAQHQMMMMMTMKSNGTTSGNVPALDEEKKKGSQIIKMGLPNYFFFFPRKHKDSHR